MSLSPYTIDVGPCKADGTRDIYLQHHQQTCFSTTHREVLRVCLARWPVRRSVEEAAHTTDLEEAESIRAQRTEDAYQTLLQASSVDRVSRGASLTGKSDAPHAPAAGLQEAAPAMEDYLCVFHREELADQHGRYTFVQPHTICTAYRVKDATTLELVLHNISPRDIAASAVGSGGVFLHGRRLTAKTRGAAAAGVVEHQGMLFKPSADTWWMGSPLSVKPVYVAVGPVAQPSTAAAPPTESGIDSDARAEENEECFVTSSIHVGEPGSSASASAAAPLSSSRQGSPLSESVVPPVEGRTAQGQFDFPRSRSSSPVPHSPPQSALRTGEPQGTGSPLHQQQPGMPAAHTRGKFIPLGATVLTQLPLYDAHSSTSSVSRQALAVVRTGADELGLAVTTPLYATDCMLWQWWPQRLQLPRLASSSSASALSVVASPHQSLRQQILFLYDAHHRRLRVLRTPDTHTGEGTFDLLFSFVTGDLPFVFPCLYTNHPAPIAVCNYPRANCISVYDVASLLERPSAEAAVMQLDLGAYQSRHPQRFGEVRLTGDGTASEARGETEMSVDTAGGCPPNAGASMEDAYLRKARVLKEWRSGQASGGVHPIRGLLYHYQALLVLHYDWPGGAEDGGGGQRRQGEDGGQRSQQPSAAGEGRGPQRRRRRCEGTITYSVTFPSLAKSDQPLVLYMLEAIGAAVGARAAASIEYALFMEAWRASCVGSVVSSAFDTCASLLKTLSMPSAGPPVPADEGCDAGQWTRKSTSDRHGVGGAAPSMFADPSALTLESIRRALPALAPRSTNQADATPRGFPIDYSALKASWTPQHAGLTLIALHLLYEACRLQEPLWKLLPSLAELNRVLSGQLGWLSYVEFYDGMISAPPTASTSEAPAETDDGSAFASVLSPATLQHCFGFVDAGVGVDGMTAAASDASRANTQPLSAIHRLSFTHGVAPDLFRVLSELATGCQTSHDADTQPVHCWPLLRHLPESHPITLANRLVQLYRDVFDGTNSAAVHSRCSLESLACQSSTSTSTGSNSGDTNGSAPQWWERVCAQLLRHRISARLVRQVLSSGVAYPLLEALTNGREAAASTWPAVLLDLVGRRDRCPPTSSSAQLVSAGRHVVEAAEEKAVARQIRGALADDDGVSVRADFRTTWRDARLEAAQNLFNTVTPISLAGYEDRPEELAGALEYLSSRARAMPLGRGMLTMCTQNFKVQDSIPIPPLNLDGRTNDGIRIANKATEELMWPLFHNGCAAGLRFLPLPPSFLAAASTAAGVPVAGGDGAELSGQGTAPPSAASAAAATTIAAPAQTITKQWVMYQTKNIGNAAARAGLLLATGILGHLTVLQRTDIFYLLISRQEQYACREATTMAVMLGLSCSFCGTSSEAVFRCLSVHVQSLNPSAEDIEVSLDVQTAALVSMGLLCQQSPSNTFLVEVFLVEISRLPTDEHCNKREGYVLGAGFGLGQLLLGVGAGHGVPHVEDRLVAFMDGAPRRSAVSAREGVEFFEETMARGEAGHFLARALLSQEQREATFNSCASVYEGECYNAAVSGPAAAVALGLTYLQTNSALIAAKLAPPNRRTALQRLTPLMSHLRSTMASLVCWAEVRPTRAWLFAQLPSSLMELVATPSTVRGLAVQQRNYLLMNLAHCLAGHVMALGLRYAGTLDTRVRDVLLGELHGFLSGKIGSTTAAIPAVQRVTGAYETCLLSCASALSMVMAGSGDLRIFHALQHLHQRSNLSYGSHMAVSMSMGLLFLGSGRLTLSNNIASVAALLMAFYPVWPADPEDNTHHLQSLRHLYGLAVVPRVMEAVDAVSHQPVSVPVRIVLRDRVEAEVAEPAVEEDDSATQEEATMDSAEQPVAQPAAARPPVREVRARTPCLYPPLEMIERVEVLSRRHYPLVFDHTSRELTQSASMVFAVMAKDSVTHGLSGGRVSRSPLEARLVDWLHRIFHQPSTTPAEALTVLSSVKLMEAVQRRLAATSMARTTILSSDFSAAMRAAMEKRYAYVFLHGTAASPVARETPHHPLYQLVVEGASYAAVLRSIAAHPHGTAAFPCDFSSLLSAGHDEERDDVDVAALHRWMTESLHFYGLGREELRKIRDALAASGDSLRSSNGGGSVSALTRLTSLLKLPRDTGLPLTTLERVWDCCI